MSNTQRVERVERVERTTSSNLDANREHGSSSYDSYGGYQQSGSNQENLSSRLQQAGKSVLDSPQVQQGVQHAQIYAQKAADTAQYAASQLRETGDRVYSQLRDTMHNPSRATPYVVPILAVLLFCMASMIPLTIMAKNHAKDKVLSYIPGYDRETHGFNFFGRHHEEPEPERSYLSEKFANAKESLLNMRNDYMEPEEKHYSYWDKLMGRRSALDDVRSQSERIRNELDRLEGLSGEYWRSAKNRAGSSGESAQEGLAEGAEYILQSIDALSDKLHQLRRQYIGRTREEKPAGWLRGTWDNIADGMDRLRYKMMKEKH